MIDKFHQISINGRYIYCYLCLRNLIASESLADIPHFLNVILKQFTNSSRLDIWHDSVGEALPSLILDEGKNADRFKSITYEHVLILRDYYSHNKLAADLIEDLIWLGMANLYGGFDSDITFEYVKDVIELMNSQQIALPDFSIVSKCSVNEYHGWGDRVNMDDFLEDR